MAVRLEPGDLNQLAAIIREAPEATDAASRADFLRAILLPAPPARSNELRARIDRGGAPGPFANHLVLTLAGYGQLGGREALSYLVNYLIPLTGEEHEDFLRGLFATYSLDLPVADRPAGDFGGQWRGRDDPAAHKEKIFGENTLRDVAVLERAIAASRSVARVRAAAKVGTGFLIARNLILTCNHVLADPGERTDTVLDFFYELDATDRERTPIVARLDPNGIFWTDVSLDATMAQLTEESASALEAENCLPLTRRRTRPRVGDRVSIIQHPLGGLKQVSFQNNFAEFVDDTVLQYTTGTLPGSSGSPVFDTDFRGVVAIHNSGGRLSEPGTSYFYLRNQGTLLEAIARSGGIE